MTGQPYFEMLVPPLVHVFPLKAEDGRPFGEANAGPAATAGVEFEWRVCKFSGHRLGKPMNVSALDGIVDNWSPILVDTDFIRAIYMRHHGVGVMSMWDVWRTTKLILGTPVALLRLGWQSARMPLRLKGLFEIAQGLDTTIERALLSGAASVERLIGPVRREEFIDLIEAVSAFENFTTGKVCAGTPHMVEQYVDVTLNGIAGATSWSPPAAAPEVWGPWREHARLLLAYEERVGRMLLLRRWWHVRYEVVAARLAEELRGSGLDLAAPLRAWLRAREALPPVPPGLASMMEPLLRANGALPEVGEDDRRAAREEAAAAARRGEPLPADAERCVAAWAELLADERAVVRSLIQEQSEVEALFPPRGVERVEVDLFSPMSLGVALKEAFGIERAPASYPLGRPTDGATGGAVAR